MSVVGIFEAVRLFFCFAFGKNVIKNIDKSNYIGPISFFQLLLGMQHMFYV